METESAAAAAMEHLPLKMRVMAAIDESDESFYALKWALDNLFSFISSTALPETGEKSDGLLTVVHVQEPNHHFGFPAAPGIQAYYPPSEVVDSVKRAQEQKSAAILKKASEMCKEKRITAKTLILDGDPKDMICQATEQIHVDLLIVGSRGLGKVKRAFLGSVSDYCAQHARCPILIVKPPKEDSKSG
ncbi:hypothetical protein SLEP1_g43816 [Rubroshorea leprosula]|uniref:UspA domain-containing protein n=1 Tax=Rubroshorea leprosula TaxID=152421 RepID=A0AAV5LEP7_9ROSI|nr:hypothetical protein SLEP1_g43816 [Rubroshorea leprosula]